MSSHPGRWTVVLVGCVWVGLLGCEAKTVVEVVPVSEVAVAPSSITLAVGATQQLEVTLKGSGGHALGRRGVTWSSSNASAVTVSQAGLVMALGAGTATITATSEGRSGSAAVTVPTYTLVVAKAGTGSGTVTSSPAGINCGTACQGSYASGTVVTLTATASSGSVFAGWSGACTGTASTCQVTMSQSRSVTATFNASLTLLYSDDFSFGLGNWVKKDPDGLGSWIVENGELIGDYNIGCGSTTCNQTQLLLADHLQPGSGDWRMEVRSGLIVAYTDYMGGAIGNVAKFSLWVSDSEKEAFDTGFGWQGLTAPSTCDSVWTSHAAYPWSQVGVSRASVATWVPSEWQTVALEKRGNQYSVFFNGVHLYSVTRVFSKVPKIGFHTYGRVRMDGFKLFRIH